MIDSATIPAATKMCPICRRRRRRASFNVDRTKRYGLQSLCRDCQKGNYQRGTNRVVHLARTNRYHHANPQARRAQHLVERAVLRGRLTPEPCACGSAAKTEAHHHRGYHHPLDVAWVCRSCHVTLEPRRGTRVA